MPIRPLGRETRDADIWLPKRCPSLNGPVFRSRNLEAKRVTCNTDVDSHNIASGWPTIRSQFPTTPSDQRGKTADDTFLSQRARRYFQSDLLNLL